LAVGGTRRRVRLHADVPRLREQIMTVGIPDNDQIGDYMDKLLAAVSKYK
jgi:hypothetical protein